MGGWEGGKALTRSTCMSHGVNAPEPSPPPFAGLSLVRGGVGGGISSRRKCVGPKPPAVGCNGACAVWCGCVEGPLGGALVTPCLPAVFAPWVVRSHRFSHSQQPPPPQPLPPPPPTPAPPLPPPGGTRTPVGLAVNWARSVLEGQDVTDPVKHATAAARAGLLSGVMFSGCSDRSDSKCVWQGVGGDGVLSAASVSIRRAPVFAVCPQAGSRSPVVAILARP